MKHIYIVDDGARASVYGVGTYIKQLIECLRLSKDVCLNVLHFRSNEKEIKIVEKDFYRIFYFPSVPYISASIVKMYYRNIFYALKGYILLNDNDQLFFHLNYHMYSIVNEVKRIFPASHIFYTIHFQDSFVAVKGDTLQFEKFVKDSQSKQYRVFQEEKDALKNVDAFICLTKFACGVFEKYYNIPAGKIFLIYNGLKDDAVFLMENDRIKQKGNMQISDNEKIILFVGRLDTIKGVDVLIEAFKLVVEKNEKCRLVIVGEGDFQAYLKKSEGYLGRIIFTGKLDKEEVCQLYQIADVGVLPSFYEQCSYVIIEMMMYGIPVIGTTAIGLDEMLECNKAKIVENKISPVELSKVILHVLNSKTDHKKIRDVYLKKYSHEGMKNRIQKLYGLD